MYDCRIQCFVSLLEVLARYAQPVFADYYVRFGRIFGNYNRLTDELPCVQPTCNVHQNALAVPDVAGDDYGIAVAERLHGYVLCFVGGVLHFCLIVHPKSLSEFFCNKKDAALIHCIWCFGCLAS